MENDEIFNYWVKMIHEETMADWEKFFSKENYEKAKETYTLVSGKKESPDGKV